MAKKKTLKQLIIAKYGGNLERFYKEFPTKEAWEAACGGALPKAQSGWNFGAPVSSTPLLPAAGSYSAANQNTQMVNPYTAEAAKKAAFQKQMSNSPYGRSLQGRGEAPLESTPSPLDLGPAAMEGALATIPGLVKSIGQEAVSHYGQSAFHKRGGQVFPQIQSADGFFSMGYENVPAPYQNGSFQTGGNYPAASTTGVAPIAPVNYRSNGKFMGKYAPGQEWKYLGAQGDTLGARLKLGKTSITGQPYWDVMTSPDPADASSFGTFNPYDSASYSREHFNGDPADEVRRLEKISIQSGNRKLGGSPGEVFHAAAPFPKNGRQAYGRPTFGPQFIAQDGLAGVPDYLETDIFNNDINAYTGDVTPKIPSGANYQWPKSPDYVDPSVFSQLPGGAYNIPNVSYGSKKMGGMMKCSCGGKMGKGGACMKCGGSKMANGGNPPMPTFDITNINTPNYFGEKLKYFTGGVQNMSTQAILAQQEAEAENAEMNSMHIMPDGSSMKGPMAYGGTPEMFPYAMPYEYKNGGIHIKPENRGKFTAYKKRTGNTTEEALHSRDPHVRQMANFARNAAGWKKQEGGPQDDQQAQIQQLIMQYAAATGSTPEAIVEEIQALPEEQQQAKLQEMQQTLNQTQTAKFGGTRALAKYDGATAGSAYTPTKDQADEDARYQARRDKQDLEDYRKSRSTRYSDGYRRNQYNDGYINQGQYNNYPAGFNQGYGWGNMPGRSTSVKYKNVNTYYNGVPGDYTASTNSQGAPQSWSNPGGGWGDVTTSRPGLLGGRKYHVSWGTGDRPYTPPAEKQRSWVGQKLHDMGPNIDKYRTPFPSKARKAGYEEDQAWEAGKPERDAKYAAQKAIEDQQNAYIEASDALPPSRSSIYTPEEEAYLMETDPMRLESTSSNPGPWGDNAYIPTPVATMPPGVPALYPEVGPNTYAEYNAATEAPTKASTWNNPAIARINSVPGIKAWFDAAGPNEKANILQGTSNLMDEGKFRHGGSHEVDDELELSPKELARLKKMGYKFDYI